MTNETPTKRTPATPEDAGEVRERLRGDGWRADLGWTDVGAGSAASAVRAAGEQQTRRTIAYLPSLRAVDQGAARVWKEGDVAVPPEADAREVMVAEPDVDEWQPETFEAPAETVESASALEAA